MNKTEQNSARVIATRPVRHDGADKVTGRANFADDIHLTESAAQSA